MDKNDGFERVKFYKSNDLSIRFYFNRIEEVISNRNMEKIDNINDIIELYNVELFFENGKYFNDWSKNKLKEYEIIVKKISKIIGIYFSNIELNKLESIFNTLDLNYVDDFWKIIEKYNIYNKIPVEVFRNMALNKKFRVKDILKCKKISQHFSTEIVIYMEKHLFCAEILMDYYLVEHGDTHDTLNFPKELTNKKKN